MRCNRDPPTIWPVTYHNLHKTKMAAIPAGQTKQVFPHRHAIPLNPCFRGLGNHFWYYFNALINHNSKIQDGDEIRLSNKPKLSMCKLSV